MTWELIGFANDSGALTHQINLDDALGRLLHLPAGERGPVYVSAEAVRTLARILVLPLEQAGGRFIMEQEPPQGWLLREVDDHGSVDEIDVDWELTRVFSEMLGVDLDFMRGPAFGDAFPLGRPEFGRLVGLFALDLTFDGTEWTLEVFANSPREG